MITTVPKAKINLKRTNDEPVYLITSFRRSGSSMMARCLEGGGLPVMYNSYNDWRFNGRYARSSSIRGGKADNSYIPNPNGFYTIEGFVEFEWPDFYEKYKGKVVKIPRLELFYLPPGNYKLIFMTRNPEEIKASYRDFLGIRTWGRVECALHFYEQNKNATIDLMKARGDIDVIEIEYRQAVNEPLTTFTQIKDFGVPINVNEAASLVDPKLYRNRLEEINK